MGRSKKTKTGKKGKAGAATAKASTDENDPQNQMQVDETLESPSKDEEEHVWLPGMELGKGETLEPDLSAYIMLHQLETEWPCLSFDIAHHLKADAPSAATFPVTTWTVAGTQAEQAQNNDLMVMRWSNLKKTQEKDEEDSESDSDEDEGDEKSWYPRNHAVGIKHDGGVNRIRLDHTGNLAATWSDTGKVYIHNLKSSYEAVASTDAARDSSYQRTSERPLYTITGKYHRTEGYALNWAKDGQRLLSGDCNGAVYLTQVNDGKFVTESTPFIAHGGSVEDLHWSSSESTVFASSSVDGSIKVWDTRMPRNQPGLSTAAHGCDVNVISWNPNVANLLASGADDGVFKVWDLRNWKPAAVADEIVPVVQFGWHSQQITSVEWNPNDSAVLAVAGADDQVTLWDLSVTESEGAGTVEGMGSKEIPPQLLFIHQGQREVKEVHWHREIEGLLVSTSLTGFNIFKTISV